VSELDDARQELRAATERAEGLARMSSLELRAAVSQVHAVAAELQAHHDSVRAAGQRVAVAYLRVQQLADKDALASWPQITPDFGPPPDDAMPGWVKDAYYGLLASLNERSVAMVARYLGELNGWLPGDSSPGDEDSRSRAPEDS
jgi:hypothetical protein